LPTLELARSPRKVQHGGVGEERSTPDRTTDELIAELRDRVRSLEEANRENRRIIAALTQRRPELPAAPETGLHEPARRRISSWWKDKFGAAMVGMLTAFAVLAANGEENPLRSRVGGEEQARVPPTPATTEPAPGASEPVPTTGLLPTTEPVPTEPVATEPVPTEPAPTEPAPTEPVREPDAPPN
jgi:hypothetical protein